MKRLTHILEQHSAALLVFGLVIAFGTSSTGTFLTGSNFENITRQISLDAPMVFGQAVVLIAGGIDISVGSTMAMAAALSIGLQPYGTPVAVFGALAFGLGIGLLNGLLVTRGKIVAFVATLGTMSVVRGLLLTYTGQQSLSGRDPGFAWWGGGQIGPVPVPLLIVLVLLGFLYVLLEHTRYGRNLYAVGGNKDAAFLGGVSVNNGLMLAFTISGVMSAVSGILVASRLNSASVQLGGEAPLMSISAALIGGASLLGGKGSIVAAFLGVLALGILNNGMNLLGVPTYNQIAIRALILVAIVAIDALATRLRQRELSASRVVE
jgi:ribose/xylose/arabinose/galactoside ABC-type transport system permease subunit